MDLERYAKFKRGPGVATRKLKDKKLRGQLQYNEQLSKQAAVQAAKADEWLLPSEAGALETEGMERSYRLSQVLWAHHLNMHDVHHASVACTTADHEIHVAVMEKDV